MANAAGRTRRRFSGSPDEAGCQRLTPPPVARVSAAVRRCQDWTWVRVNGTRPMPVMSVRSDAVVFFTLAPFCSHCPDDPVPPRRPLHRLHRQERIRPDGPLVALFAHIQSQAFTTGFATSHNGHLDLILATAPGFGSDIHALGTGIQNAGFRSNNATTRIQNP